MNKITEHRKFILQLEKEEKRTSVKEVKVSFFSVELDKNTAHFFIYRPSYFQEDTSEDTIYPTILHIRGTGYNASASYYANIICSQLAEKSHCQVIDIDHRLAPEFKCPVGFNDSYAKIKYICNNPKIFKVDLNNVAILGYSSGGNFAALSAIQAKKDNLPISLQLLVSPLTDLSRSLKRYLSFEDKDTFPLPLAEWFIDLYLSDPSEKKSPSISPYWSELNDLNHLPPTFFLFGEFDRFRSDSENYRNKLIKAGVWTYKSIFKNTGHSFFWKDIRAIEKIGAQVYTAFNLSTIQRPIEKKEEVFEEKISEEKSLSVLKA